MSNISLSCGEFSVTFKIELNNIFSKLSKDDMLKHRWKWLRVKWYSIQKVSFQCETYNKLPDSGVYALKILCFCSSK